MRAAVTVMALPTMAACAYTAGVADRPWSLAFAALAVSIGTSIILLWAGELRK